MATFEITYSHATDSVALPGDGTATAMAASETPANADKSTPAPSHRNSHPHSILGVPGEPLTYGTRTLIL